MADVIYRVGDGALTLLADQTSPVFIENGDEATITAWVSRPGVIAQAGAPAPSATAPEAFTSGQWSINAAGEVTITALPADGGSAITDLEYRIGVGSAVSFGATTTGTYATTAEEADSVQIRAVNGEGAGDWSDAKVVPAAPATSGPVEPVQLFANNNVSSIAEITATLGAQPTEGNILIAVAMSAGGNPSTQNPEPPAGWDRVLREGEGADTTAMLPRLSIYTRKAGADDPGSLTLTGLSTTMRWRLVIMEFQNPFGATADFEVDVGGGMDFVNVDPTDPEAPEITVTHAGTASQGALALGVVVGRPIADGWGEPWPVAWSDQPNGAGFVESEESNTSRASYTIAAQIVPAAGALSVTIAPPTAESLSGAIIAFRAAS